MTVMEKLALVLWVRCFDEGNFDSIVITVSCVLAKIVFDVGVFGLTHKCIACHCHARRSNARIRNDEPPHCFLK
jgi:hypothetical protein